MKVGEDIGKGKKEKKTQDISFKIINWQKGLNYLIWIQYLQHMSQSSYTYTQLSLCHYVHKA